MCGIVGFAGRGSLPELLRMLAAVEHRGPDGEGVFVDDHARAFLGHRRLSILDLVGGSQPMWNEDDRVGIVFNGEIYNHVELRIELERSGHVFRSNHSDTEVLVHGYEEWGEGLPERLNGMFAFAVYDRTRHRFFLARDRFGEKPLYYAHRPGLFAFASELGALVCHSEMSRSLDLLSLQKFFAYGYIPAPHALYDGSRKLPAGHHLTFDLDSGSVEITAYWRFTIEPDERLDEKDEPALVEELRYLLSQAVRRRLISDVPLGIFLSGGVDSSTVLAMAARHLEPRSIRTFTLGFTEPSYDESGVARRVAKAIGTDHNEKLLDRKLARHLMPNVLGRLSEPLGDASVLPTYLLSEFTRQHVTVALSGDGGDELFAGYDPFKALTPARLYASIMPSGIHASVRRLADLLPISSRSMSFDFKLRRTLMGLSYHEAIWNPVWMSPIEPRAMAELFNDPVRVEDVYGDAIALWQKGEGKCLADRTLEFYTNFYLQDDILTKVDRATMMVSLESRAIFLDNDLVEFCRRLPYRFKVRNGDRKYLLKKAMRADLPREVTSRPKKGFGVPLVAWLRDIPAPAALIPEIDCAEAHRLYEDHHAGVADHRLFLWSYLSLQHTLSSGAVGAHRTAA